MTAPKDLPKAEMGAAEPGRPRAATSHPALPRQLTAFLGREELVSDVVGRLRAPGFRLLTLTGPGGVGKTRLALRVAEVARADFPDGTLFVPLAPVVDPALVLPAIARGLDVSEGGDRPIVERLAHALGDRRLLLVLDNLEQVLVVAPLVTDLLRETSGITVLATSRAPLHVEGEHELAVPPMLLPASRRHGSAAAAESEAVRFFLARARVVNPALTLSPSGADAVAEIVRRLDGLPLALELAAARTKVLSPEALLARLTRQLHVLTGGPQDRPARQQTMRQAIAWSHGLLGPAERALFRRLAVFRGGFDLEDAERVLDGMTGEEHLGGVSLDPIDILDGVSSLADQSLIAPLEGDGGEVRFRMLETIREFGLEQLAASGDSDAVHRRFAARWQELADATWGRTARLDDLDVALGPLEHNRDNIRAALDWLEQHDPPGAANLAGALFWFWYVRGHHAEARRRLLRLVALPQGIVPAPLRPRVLLGAGIFSHFQRRTEEAEPMLEAALAGWREAGDAWGTGFTLLALGIIAEDTERWDLAAELLAEAVDRLGAVGDAGSVGTARYHLAVVALGGGDLDRAVALVEDVLWGGDGPAVRIAAWAIHLRGLLSCVRGDPSAGLRDFQEALRRFRDARYPAGVEDGVAGAAIAAAAVGLPVALHLWAVAERLSHESGHGFQQPERDIYRAAMARLRTQLGDEVVEAERTAAPAWSDDEAVAVALELELPAAASTPAPTRLDGLTGREREVLRLVAKGWANDRIAGELSLSPRTVQTHLGNIFRKIDVVNRTEAVLVALSLLT